MSVPFGYAESDFGSAPLPDDPDYRTNTKKPSNDAGSDVRQATRTTPGQAPPLAIEKDILAIFLDDFRRAGVVGEERLGQLIYLALTSRMLPWDPAAAVRPVSLLPKGTTSTGKSHATGTTLRFFPEQTYFSLGSFSRRYLFYEEETFSHRIIYVPEWASIKEDEEIVAMLRILLSEGRIVHGTVEGEGKRSARRIEKKGPTGLIVTTTEAAVDTEMETRLFAVATDDTPEQTRRVFHKIAGSQKGASTLDLGRWHELQDWISSHGETPVYVPFADALAELIPADATRLRRDFGSLLNLVRAHTILHRANRQPDEDGYLLATVESDYAPVRLLVGRRDLGERRGERYPGHEGDRRSRPGASGRRQGARKREGPDRPSRRRPLGRFDRIRRALFAGYLSNETSKNERGYKLVIGSPLPGDEAFLPSPADVVRVMSGRAPGQRNADFMRVSEGLSGSPGRPANPPDKRVPRLGEEMFPVLLADAVKDGHITEDEATERYAIHKMVATR